MFMRLGRATLRAGLIAVAAGKGGAAIALATIPDSNGVIHGCYRNFGGALRVIDTSKGQKCVSGETALSWNQTGPKGATGLKGPTGDRGPTGSSAAALIGGGSASKEVPGNGGTYWFSALDSGSPSNDTDGRQTLPTAGRLAHFTATLNIAPGAGLTWVFTVVQNGSPTNSGCSITGAATTCTDSTDTIAFSAGDQIDVRATTSANVPASIVRWSATYG